MECSGGNGFAWNGIDGRCNDIFFCIYDTVRATKD